MSNVKAFSNAKIFTVAAVIAALAGAAYAAPGRGGGGGGGGGGRGGGGGVPHAIGGGGHIGGGGMRMGGGGGGPHFGGAPRIGGGPAIGGMRGGGGPRLGGVRVGGAPRFASRPAISHFAARPAFHSQRSIAARSNPNRAAALKSNGNAAISRSNAAISRNVKNANVSIGPSRTAAIKSNSIRNALNSSSVAGMLHNHTSLRNPNARAQLVATAATAGWHAGRGDHDHNGWWRHRHGGFGWVGPLFWPLAYYDIYDYTLWGYGYDPLFWDYGYNDIYAGVFAPYGYDDLAAYLPPGGGGPGEGSQVTVGRVRGAATAPTATSGQLAPLCGDDSREIAGLPIDQIQQVIQPNDAQRAALDQLADASMKAAQDIKAACPTQISLTAPGRLAAMQQRIEAMISAVETVRPPLQKFYDLLSDEQRARLNALAQDQRNAEATQSRNGSLVQDCRTAQASVPEWPAAEIEARVHPTEAQHASLAALQQASAKAVDMLKASCPTTEPITPPARLEAIANRLDNMLQAVKSVRAALDDFYGKLSDEQRAQFEAIGPARAGPSPDGPAASDQQPTPRTHARRYHHAGIPGIIRHLMSMARW
ncbi:Spy/CpxP family protein refolding chaperone [Bradyrhizobium sp.]|uniref:Spy/CpxP family protein refolding chaperone n=1 Tax=Bradyrhizobium sp. TaxID=376 RepID=UPI003BB03EB1